MPNQPAPAARAPGGDVDVASVATLFADPTRARVLAALSDGRALPASVLAAEAGVAAPVASNHLARLREAGLVECERSGRNRYYRIADQRVAQVLEALARLAPTRPISSLREHTRAAALRGARSCYDHLAGRLGVAVTAALIERGALETTDGIPDNRRRAGEELATPPAGCPYQLGPRAGSVFAALGVDFDASGIKPGSRRPELRACMDWSEQRHHLAGRLGADLLTAMRGCDWVRPGRYPRVLTVTDSGRDALREVLGVEAA